MAPETKSICDTEAVAVLADKGYHNGEQLAACQREDIYTYVAYQEVPRQSRSHPGVLRRAFSL